MKRKILYAIIKLLYYLKGFEIAFFFRNLSKPRLTILMFHRVTDGTVVGLPTISIGKGNYEKLIKLIKRYFTVISVHDLLEAKKTGKKLPRRAIMLTFDDAYEETYLYALSALQRYSVPSTMFAVAKTLGTSSVFWWDAVFGFLSCADLTTPVDSRLYSLLQDDLKKNFEEILLMSWKDRIVPVYLFIEHLKNLDFKLIDGITNYLTQSYNRYLQGRHGPLAKSMTLNSLLEFEATGSTIGSHTMTHRFLTKIPIHEVREELCQSKSDLELNVNKRVIAFAYPSGMHNQEIVQEVKKAGYSLAFTTISGVNTAETSLFELKRINIWDNFVCDKSGDFSASLTLWRLLLV
ncbi:MAG: polysaccharide deacetylase family protein [Bdellovibrio sp.]|nr:polysaccharide deacetylase family protein [Bdellovibrio sp.]